VTDDGDGTSHASATLRVGGATSNTLVELAGEDNLAAMRDGEEPIDLFEQSVFDVRSYRVDYADDTPDLDVHVAFTRGLDDGAPDSAVSLPAPFELDPLEGAYSGEDHDLVLTWDHVAEEEVALHGGGGLAWGHRKRSLTTWSTPG
jgi:hypothetical protein